MNKFSSHVDDVIRNIFNWWITYKRFKSLQATTVTSLSAKIRLQSFYLHKEPFSPYKMN
ncbi:MAG: hypothetical protein R3B53_01175 [Candidatus Paceibacterota bacterium]